MSSLRSRFNGKSDEVLDCVRRFGVHETMRRYEVRDYLSMVRWVKEMTGVDNYGKNPEFSPLSSSSSTSLLNQLVEGFADYVVRKETEIKRKDEKIEMLMKKLAYYEAFELDTVEPKIVKVIEDLKTP